MPDDKKVRLLKDIPEEELASMDPQSLYVSLMLATTVEYCFMSGVPLDIMLSSVKQLYEAISEQLKERAN